MLSQIRARKGMLVLFLSNSLHFLFILSKLMEQCNHAFMPTKEFCIRKCIYGEPW